MMGDFDAASRSIDAMHRELEQLDAEIRQARSREVRLVIDQILKTMADRSISLADLERYLGTQDRRASRAGVVRIPSAAWSPKVPAQIREQVRRTLDEMPGVGDTYVPDYRERVWTVVQKVARAWGGQCLSADYEGRNAPHEFECAAGHRFQLSIMVLRRGGWCQACHRARATIHTLGEARALATRQGGVCLSTRYEQTRAKLRWRCAAGHEWQAAFEAVLRGDWCQTCHFQSIKPRQEDIDRVAIERGGRCLSAYVDKYTPLDWQCAAGHTWSAPWFRVSKGQWCHRCAVKARTRTIEQMQDLAKSRGGRCLSTVYPGVHEKLELECGQGHTWKATVNSVWRGSWCPECAVERRRLARNRRRGKGAAPILL